MHEEDADRLSDFDDAETLVLGGDNDVGTSSTNCDMTDNDPQFWSAWGSPFSCDSDSEWDGISRVNPAVAFDFAMASPGSPAAKVLMCVHPFLPVCSVA